MTEEITMNVGVVRKLIDLDELPGELTDALDKIQGSVYAGNEKVAYLIIKVVL